MTFYWAIEFDPRTPLVKHVRLVGALRNFTSPQARAAWVRKSPRRARRIALRSTSFEVLYAMKGKPRAWCFSNAARIEGRQRGSLFYAKP